MEQVFIINGSGEVGKDTFIKMFECALNCKKTLVLNYSSVEKVKRVAEFIGWNGAKTEKDRKFLSDLKLLTTEYNDMAFNDMIETVEDFYNFVPSFNKVCFLHIREPEEIDRMVKKLNAKTILMKRDSVKHITSNMADENVFNYDYDIVIENDGTLEELKEKAKLFVNDLKNSDLKERY